MNIIFDLDDYYSEANCLPELLKLKKEIPTLRVTLFTIPAKISDDLLEETAKYKWIQMAVHGYTHEGNFEFAKLSYSEAIKLIVKGYNSKYYVKGFKAPGWQISIGTMEALRDLGFWLAVQYPDDRLFDNPDGPYQPAVITGLKYYAFRQPPENCVALHGHTWQCCGNGLQQIKTELRLLADAHKNFKFIGEII